MGVLRKKGEPTETVTVRVPSRVKAELDRLREETGAAAGFDLNATLSDAVVRVTKQICEELRQLSARGPWAGPTAWLPGRVAGCRGRFYLPRRGGDGRRGSGGNKG